MSVVFNDVSERPWLKHYPEEVNQNIDFSKSKTLAEMLDETARSFPEHIALHFMGKDVTYKQLDVFVRKLALKFSGMGIEKRDRVALLLPNCPQAVISYFATVRLGAIVVPCNPLYTEKELAYQIKDSGALTIVTLDLFYPKVKKVRDMIGEKNVLQNIIIASIPEFLPKPISWLYPLGYQMKLKRAIKEIAARKESCSTKHDKECVQEAEKQERILREDLIRFNEARIEIRKDAKMLQFFGAIVFRKADQKDFEVSETSLPSPSDIAVLQYTGGTTGRSKGAMLTHANLWTNAKQVATWFFNAEPGKEKFLGALPLFHIFAMTAAQNVCIMLGGELLLIPKATDISSVMEVIAKKKPTVIPGVPRLFSALSSHYAEGQDWHSVKACISGGAKLPAGTLEKFESITGGKLVEGFGLTEASPVTHCNPLNGNTKLGSIGTPLPGTDAKIMVKIPSGYREAEVGEDGDLWIRGPQVMLGYWNSTEETENVLTEDGWLKTGDIAARDEDGYFFIRDRSKNMILSDSGFNVYPSEIEEVLRLHPAVMDAAAIGLPVNHKEVIKAFVVLKPGYRTNPEELISHCKTSLAPYKVPKQVEFRTELPLTIIGKTLHRVLREEEIAKRAKEK